jgi:MoxR-like ATPase
MSEGVELPGADVGRTLVENVCQVVRGKREEVSLVVAALAAGGHVLLEDVPGTAKTMLARALGRSITGATVTRIQGTPDLQPTDATGLSVFDQRTQAFEFRPGPLFANVVLVDEINRAMPRTQSALLEAMAEGQVTVDGESRTLPRPYLLIATENPIEQEGTFPLPEAQLDRFLLKTGLGYPDADDERRIVREQRAAHPIDQLEPVVSVADVDRLQDSVAEVYVDELLLEWIVGLVRATRTLEGVALGASVRASLALERAARAWALLEGRSYAVPEDVERLFLPVVAHRMLFGPTLLLELRERGREAGLRAFWERCLAAAPRPALERLGAAARG